MYKCLILSAMLLGSAAHADPDLDQLKPALAKGVNMETRDITFDLVFPVSVSEAWSLWTDSGKLEQWLTAKANVEARLGGPYELFWDPSTPSDNSTLGCKVMALAPHRLLAFEWRGPVPFADLMNVEPFPTWASVSFEAIAPNETHIHFRHSGWGTGERWDAARDWQKNAWSLAFDELIKSLSER